MLNLQFSPFPFFETERLSLRPVTENDAEEIFVLRSHPEINKYIHRERAQGIQDAIDFIQKITKQQEEGHSITWAICEKGSTTLIGSVCFWNVNREEEQAELGYSLNHQHFNKGYMSECLVPVLDYGFNSMLLERIDAYTNKDNLASLNLLRKMNFNRNLAFEEVYEDKEELTYNVIYTRLKR